MSPNKNKKGFKTRRKREKRDIEARLSALARATEDPAVYEINAQNSVSDSLLNPVILPLKDQHVLLSNLQYILEEMCENFGLKNDHYRSVLHEHGWTEPKSLELHSWCRVILGWPIGLSSALAEVSEEERKNILLPCIRIRHAAVHRLPQSTESILGSLEAAIGLANMHRDTAVVQRIENLRTELQAIIKDTHTHGNTLQGELRIQLNRISAEQARLKQEAMDKVKIEIGNSFEQAGARLSDYINSSSYKMTSAANISSDNEDYSEPDIEGILREAENRNPTTSVGRLPG